MHTPEIQSVCPSNTQEWRIWLEKNHKTSDAVWVIMYKKKTEIPSITWSEAVDEALCFGWIDSTKRAIDDEKYMQYFGKRKAKTTWSKINKIKVENLIAQNLMFEAGLESIEIAKQNGSWSILDTVEALIVPDDLEQELSKYPNAKDFFLSLSKSAKKGILHWIFMAKRPETREKRIKEIALQASKGKKPKPF